MDTKVVLYRPNLIGYSRLMLLLGAVFCEGNAFIALYVLSVSLDYFDGMAARAFGEESRLGACLDMITDRISTTILCIRAMQKKPYCTVRCMLYIFFDLLSHFLYFTSMIHANTHHKSFQGNPLLRLYYNSAFLKLMCCGSELYFIGLYYMKSEGQLLRMLAAVPLAKTFFHIMHLWIGVSVLSTVAK